MSGLDGSTQEKTFGGHQYRIREVAAADEPKVIRLFVEVFGHQPEGQWFAWKYGAGRAGALGLWDESGCLKAHYAGIPRAILWQGNPVTGLQIGDVMVSPEIRGLMMRKGPFQEVCSRFFDTRVGAGRPYRFAWGFPNQRHLRLGLNLGLYRDAGVISQLSWPATPEGLPPWWQFSALDGHSADFDRQVDSVWQAMADDLRGHVLGSRDSAYLRWRFLARPDRQYRLFALRRRFTVEMEALAVMRFAEGGAELLDVVGPRGVFPHAVRAAVGEAARAGAKILTAWASPALVELALATGAVAVPSGASLAISTGSDLTAVEITQARWWLMGGDTDFL